MTEGSNNQNLKGLRRSISVLKINENQTFDVVFEEVPGNKRMQSIRALLNTECTYLKRINELLTVILNVFERNFDRIGKRNTMSQVVELLENFPTIYQLHFTFHNRIKEQLQTSKEVGKVLVEFLSQTELLEVYTNYIKNFSRSSKICKYFKEKGYHIKYPELSQLESIIMSPVQRFPQFNMALEDIYKNIPNIDKEKAPFYQAVSLSKSITAQLNRQRQEFDYTNFSTIQASLTKLKLQFSSKQLLINNSVYEIRTDFFIPRRMIKIAYYLILYDNNVVMIPKDVPLTDLTDKIAFCYSLEEISFSQYPISNFWNRNNCYADFEEAKNLYNLVNDSFTDNEIIKEYEELFNDYKTILKINEETQKLKFRYKDIDTLKISKSLIQLQQQLKSKETELNLQLGSILKLNIKPVNYLEDKKVFIFDSIRLCNEWKMNFNRAKLLKNIEMVTCWKYYSFPKKLPQMKIKELPLLFQPFLLKENGIVDITTGIVTSQSLALVVGLEIYRCLLLSLENGWIIILHFDYKQWKVLESFKIENLHPAKILCISSSSNIGSPDQPYDSEIWMGCGDTILVHSLLDNQRSTVKHRLNLPSNVKALCRVDKKMFIALKSKSVFVYSKNKAPFWLQEYEISFKRYIASYTEELREIYYGHDSVFIVFKTKIIICKCIENIYSPIKAFESDNEITTLWISSEGIWTSLNNSSQLILYDRYLDQTLQIISIPQIIYKTLSVGYITSIYINEKYIWLGTEKGFIVCISKVDSMYCKDFNIPMYFSSKSSIEPITQILPFQNIHGVNLKYSLEDYTSKRGLFDQRAPPLHRSQSNYPSDNVYMRQALSCQNISRISSDLDSSSSSSLQSAILNLKNTTPVLILAIGCGIAKYTDNPDEEDGMPNPEVEERNQSVMFTFLE